MWILALSGGSQSLTGASPSRCPLLRTVLFCCHDQHPVIDRAPRSIMIVDFHNAGRGSVNSRHGPESYNWCQISVFVDVLGGLHIIQPPDRART